MPRIAPGIDEDMLDSVWQDIDTNFVLAIDQFSPPVRALAYLLPVTHGIQLLQDLMLRGSTNHLWQVGALIAIATVTLVAAWLLLRRNMRTA